MSQSDYQAFAYGGANAGASSAAGVFQQQAGGGSGMYQSNAAGPFTSAPYSQSLPAAAISAQQANLRQSASPNQPNSPFFGNAQYQQMNAPQQQIKYPMAAPPLPQTPLNTKQFPSAAPAASTPTTPQSPASAALEQSRTALLLEINMELLEEVSKLQAEGKGGATNPQYQAQLRQHKMDDKMATMEYIQTMRRVQANIAYLSPKGATAVKMLQGPAHMTPPPQMPQLQSKYDRLKELFPGWEGLDKMQQNASPMSAPGHNPMSA